MTMSADRKTAYRTSTAAGPWGTAISSTFSGTGNVYIELTVTAPINNVHIGIINAQAPNTDYPGHTTNGLSFSNNGSVYYNGTALTPPPGFNFNPGDTIAVALYGPLQLIQFRNITQNTSWSPLYSTAGVGKPPYLLAVSLDTAGLGGSVYANFYGPFVSTPPAASPAFTPWNPEALFSEQPVKVIDFDAVLTDGSYTSSNINDLEAIPFSYIKWGDAVLDKNFNLVFTDWVIDDLPIFSIVLQVAGPANNWLWAAWDYGTPFVFDKVHIPTSASVAVANIQIPPPPPTTNPQHPGQGHVLQIFSSCDTGNVFNWTQGRVHGVEDVLVWGPVEYATWPPSVIGQAQPVVGNSIQGGRFGPPIGPPLGS